MGSRVRIAAAACLVASGLLAGGASATIAFADPALAPRDSGDKHANDSSGNGAADKPKPGPDEKKTPPGAEPHPSGRGSEHSGNVGSGKEERPGTDPGEHKADGEKDDGADPGKGDGNGNGDKPDCGSKGTRGCGGEGSEDPEDPTTPTNPPPTQVPPENPVTPMGATGRTRITARPSGHGGRGRGNQVSLPVSHPDPATGVAGPPPRRRPAGQGGCRRCSCRTD